MRSFRLSAPILALMTLVAILLMGAAEARAAYTAGYPFNTRITVVNTNGIPQADAQIIDVSRNTKVGVADVGGSALVTVNSPTGIPAWTDVVTATRQVPEYSGDPCFAVPEGIGAGVPLWTGAYDALPASTVTVPTIDGPGYEPEISSDEWELLGEINARRVADDVSPVTLSTVLSNSAASYVNILPSSGLDVTNPLTYCMNSGPGMRAVDAGFPTFDIGEDIVQGASTPDAALAALAGYDHSQVLSDPDTTMIGIAYKDGTWVIDSSILALTDPGHDRAGDTGTTNFVAASQSPSAPTPTPRPTVRLARLKLDGIVHHRHSLVVYAHLVHHARGQVRVSAIRDPKHRSNAAPQIVVAVNQHRRHGRIHATLRLRPGRWRVRVRFLGEGAWRPVTRRREVSVHRPRAFRHHHRRARRHR